jgi:hypothetical protein
MALKRINKELTDLGRYVASLFTAPSLTALRLPASGVPRSLVDVFDDGGIDALSTASTRTSC